ncbi:transcriptional repressor LexA [Pseudolysobacter antarcticus]|uniref:LexA repressor n=1 Tax=Pseudolysobacter antarcticus TaxID=2511995 RepID=A0A411HJK5_9GAMM|nr:transcriptional repressor LexA [Pseudolysobacter antarcticus]QBB70678.1 transcriptional repressor LexA [Pseudolysobacter antarcticus]
MDLLTNRQQAILDFISESARMNGLLPSQAEIARAFDIQLSAVQDHLHALERKGAIERHAGKARGIRLVDAVVTNTSTLELPLVGRVAAGQPILSEAHIERQFTVDRYMFRPRPHYLLRVEGESMRDIGILHGDLIAVHRSPDATNGQIVVARIDGEITVKRFRRIRQRILLLPENPAFAPIEVDPRTDDFAIEGLYVGSIRIP